MSNDLTYTQEERASSPERILWRAVITLAVKDSRNEQSQGHHEAIHWLTLQDNKDRQIVCDLADIHEESLVSWALKEESLK